MTNRLKTKYPGGILGIMLVLLVCQKGQAQDNVLVNEGEMSVIGDTLSVHFDFNNKNAAQFKNDGNVYIYQNWTNTGNVFHSPISNGKTFFNGEDQQILKSTAGLSGSSFQNIQFLNLSSQMQDAIFSVDGEVEFLTGIVEENDNSKMIFNEKAFHTSTSNLSFVDGKVEKAGSKEFQYPVGDDLYFRPNYYSTAASQNGDAYTSQYFFKDTPNVDVKVNEGTIRLINPKEYWEVTRDKGENEIVLTLSLDSNTTPDAFFNLRMDEEIVIVRWDEAQHMWINEKGAVSEASQNGAGYTKLLMSKVHGTGIFTMAIAKKGDDIGDIVVYNALSPNGDGLNDTFLIKGIDKYPDNEVEIYNRWGVKVFSAKSYNESDNMFTGYSDGRATVNRGEKLPTGTYFYILKYNNGKKGVEKAGYLYINNQ